MQVPVLPSFRRTGWWWPVERAQRPHDSLSCHSQFLSTLWAGQGPTSSHFHRPTWASRSSVFFLRASYLRTVSVKGLSFELPLVGQPLAALYLSALSLILSFMKSETRTILFLQWVGFKGGSYHSCKSLQLRHHPWHNFPFPVPLHPWIYLGEINFSEVKGRATHFGYISLRTSGWDHFYRPPFLTLELGTDVQVHGSG